MNDDEIAERLEGIDLTPAIIKWMRRHWGPKCADFEPGCPCCEAWRRFETTGERVKEL